MSLLIHYVTDNDNNYGDDSEDGTELVVHKSKDIKSM